MEITVSSPGSPGTSFTDNVKAKIIIIFDVLANNDDFSSVRDLGTKLEEYGINWNYARNILPFLRNCGLVDYHDNQAIKNQDFFTNIGYTYVDILKSIECCKNEEESEVKNEISLKLERIQESIYFQSLVIMMKNLECNYSHDFFDVLYFVKLYGSIDSTEYLLIQYERENKSKSFLVDMKEEIEKYRNGEIEIKVLTKTKNDNSGAAKSVNSFPYVSGNFVKAGVFYKTDEGRFCLNDSRISEIDQAIEEVLICRNSVKLQ